MLRKSKTAHDDRAHAPLPPSASGRWYACPPCQGYIKRLIKQKVIKKRKSGPAAERGTRIHEIAEGWLRASIAEKRFEVSKKFKPKGAKDEIAEARAYVEFCMKKWAEACDLDAKAKCGIETKSTFTDENWGSVDFWILAAKRLTTIDLKSGREAVTAKDNTQLINYLAGIARTLPWPREFEAIIWQPNATDDLPPERAYVYDIPEFGAKLEAHKLAVANATEWLDPAKPHEKALTAGDHCTWCDAEGVCPAARERAMSISSSNFQPVTIDRFSPPPPATLEADQVAEIMRRAPSFVSWLEAVNVRALELMNKGHRVPGFKVVQRITRRAWEQKYTDAQIAKKLGIKPNDLTKSVRLSPSQVEQILPAAKRKRVNDFTFKPEGDPVVVADTDRRTPLLATRLNFTPVKRGEEDDG